MIPKAFLKLNKSYKKWLTQSHVKCALKNRTNVVFSFLTLYFTHRSMFCIHLVSFAVWISHPHRTHSWSPGPFRPLYLRSSWVTPSPHLPPPLTIGRTNNRKNDSKFTFSRFMDFSAESIDFTTPPMAEVTYMKKYTNTRTHGYTLRGIGEGERNGGRRGGERKRSRWRKRALDSWFVYLSHLNGGLYSWCHSIHTSTHPHEIESL